MRKNIHPEYRSVVFQDISTGDTFLTKSTVKTEQTIDLDGETYPLVRLDVTSSSHPFYTGQNNLIKAQGRVEKFMEKYGME